MIKRKFFSKINKRAVPILMALVLLLSGLLVWQNLTMFKTMRAIVESQYKDDVRKFIDAEIITQKELQIKILSADRDVYRALWYQADTENKAIKNAMTEKITPLLEPYGCSLEWIGSEPVIKKTAPIPEKKNPIIGVFR